MATPFEIRFDSAVFAGEADGFGLPVVFLHAGVADRRMWAGQMELLADAGYHVISYDRRGYGQTQTADEPFNALVDFETVLDQLGVHAVVLVGASQGGGLAIDFALEHPERTIGLVLIGTALTGAPEPEIPEEVEGLIDALDYAEERGNTETVNRIEAHLWLDGPLSPQGRVDGPVRELFLEMNRDHLAQAKLTKEEDRDPAIDVISRLTMPVLLVAGELDFPHILERHAELEEELDNAFGVVIEEAAHLPSLERPDLFNPILMEFLDAVAGYTELGDDDEDDSED